MHIGEIGQPLRRRGRRLVQMAGEEALAAEVGANVEQMPGRQDFGILDQRGLVGIAGRDDQRPSGIAGVQGHRQHAGHGA